MSSSQDFPRVISELRGGLVAVDLAQKMEELVTAIQASGKKGTLNLTLTLNPVGSGNREIHVSAKVAVKAPAAPDLEERSIFFAQRGQLLRHDPNQPDLYRGPVGVANGASPAENDRRTGTED
ncbi:MAG TPA: hypothetical protein VGK41_01410 [Solirubrobacterales bacterium]